MRGLRAVHKKFTKDIASRIADSVDPHQRREQAGFRKGYSISDHNHVVNEVIGKSAVYTKPLCMTLRDYEKAFDYVIRAAVLEAFKDQGIEETPI